MRVHFRSFLICAVLSYASLLLAGCGNSFDLTQGEPVTNPSVAMQGEVLGGFFPISGSHIFLFSPGTGGVGVASTSLIKTTSPGALQDITAGSITNGAYYVTTDAKGGFNFSSTCTVGSQVYLYASGGIATTGGSDNPQIGLMAAVGTCPSTGTVDAFPFIRITELSTVAAAYALAGFGDDAGHLSISGSSLSQTGIANAMATANNLLNDEIAVDSGSSTNGFTATTTTTGSTGVLPQKLLDTLANIMVACVNSGNTAAATTSGCDNLRKYATSDGATGTGPTAPGTGSFGATSPKDTATAVINIAHHPGNSNVAGLFGLQGTGASAVYKPYLASAPATFVVEVYYTGGGVINASNTPPMSLALDGIGNVWIANSQMSRVSKFSALGVPQSGSTGYVSPTCGLTGGSSAQNVPASIAIDAASANAWVGVEGGSYICILNSTGGTVAKVGIGSADGNDDGPFGIAFDANGNAWVTDDLGEGDNNSGNPAMGQLFEVDGVTHAATLKVSGTTNGLNGPTGIAIESPTTFGTGHTGQIWVSNFDNALNATATPDSVFNADGTTAFEVQASNVTNRGGANLYGAGQAIDANGYDWTVVNDNPGGLAKIPSSGSGGTYFTYADAIVPFAISIDGAGSVWFTVNGNGNAGYFGTLLEANNAGSLVSPAAGYTPQVVGGFTTTDPGGLGVDGSGNVWYTMSNGDSTLRELIGAATPVATPLSFGVKNNLLGHRP